MRRRSIRSVVENPLSNEYYVLVTRYYPMELRKRGIKLAESPIDVWDRDLAPAKQTLKDFKDGLIGWLGYEARFEKDVPRKFALQRLAKHEKDAEGKEVVLVCVEKDLEYPHCHTWILLKWKQEDD